MVSAQYSGCTLLVLFEFFFVTQAQFLRRTRRQDPDSVVDNIQVYHIANGSGPYYFAPPPPAPAPYQPQYAMNQPYYPPGYSYGGASSPPYGAYNQYSGAPYNSGFWETYLAALLAAQLRTGPGYPGHGFDGYQSFPYDATGYNRHTGYPGQNYDTRLRDYSDGYEDELPYYRPATSYPYGYPPRSDYPSKLGGYYASDYGPTSYSGYRYDGPNYGFGRRGYRHGPSSTNGDSMDPAVPAEELQALPAVKSTANQTTRSDTTDAAAKVVSTDTSGTTQASANVS